jgi:hypothetical protein
MDTDLLSHGSRLAYTDSTVNPPNVSVH